ncbi:hypothetical protein [Runella sp.]|jgi:hypothetical protein|uniref:hypothetical protein n=1 Tax=Runella sp. TaxID=1960881 RepID=UPI00261FD130|nr:hypothetical protein [Runella sp.]
MKTFMIIAALSVLSLGQVAEAQDGKSVRTQTQIVEQMMAALPTQDNYTEPKVIFSIADLRMISMLPIKDENVEMPNLAEEKTAVAHTPVLTPATPKVEVKATKIGEK